MKLRVFFLSLVAVAAAAFSADVTLNTYRPQSDDSAMVLTQRQAAALASLGTPRPASVNDVSAPAANTAAVVTYAAAGAGVSHVIDGVAWSYSGDPTGGNLKIEDGSGTVVFSIDITSGGAGYFPISRKKGSTNTALMITLAAGGSGVTGKLNVLAHWTE